MGRRFHQVIQHLPLMLRRPVDVFPNDVCQRTGFICPALGIGFGCGVCVLLKIEALALGIHFGQRFRVPQRGHIHIPALGDQPTAEVHKSVICAVGAHSAACRPKLVTISGIVIELEYLLPLHDFCRRELP